MANIRVGTTPSISFRFKSIACQDIVKAIVTFERDGVEILRKTLETATIQDNRLTWKLSQEDTIAINEGMTNCMLNWVTADGTRGTSDEMALMFDSNHIEEVI